MFKKIFLFSLLVSAVAWASCEKKPLPGGYDYKFSCKINGVPWEAKYREHEGSFSRNDLDVSVFILKDTAVLKIIATDITKPEGIGLSCMFSDTILYSNNYSRISLGTKRGNYYLVRQTVNAVKITSIDKASHIVKGTFSGKIYNDVTISDTLTITDGLFDLKYYED